MSHITETQIQNIAHLARLALTDEEATLFGGQLEDILSYIDKLSEVDIDGVEPFLNAASGDNIFRNDTPHESIPREQALANAPQQGGGFFKVPEVLQ